MRLSSSSSKSEETTHPFPLLFGVAAGALSYQGGRQEQALRAVVRWSPGVALGLGVSLPVGDTASGFGAGAAGYSASAASDG